MHGIFVSIRAAVIFSLCLGMALATEYRPSKADIIRVSGPALRGVYVIQNTMEVVHYSTDEEGRQRTRMRRQDIARVEYDVSDVRTQSFFTAQGQRERGNWEQSAAAYIQVVEHGDTEFVVVESLFGAAHCFAQMEQWDQAIATLDQIRSRFPRHERVVESLDVKGHTLIRARRLEDARQAFSELLSRADEFAQQHASFGQEARMKGHYGHGRLAQNNQDWGSAVQSFAQAQEAFAGDVAFNDELYAMISIALGDAQRQAGQSDQALETYKNLRFKPVPGGLRSQALIQAAELMLSSGAHLEAFDHAIMAAIIRGSTVRTQARRLANRIFSESIEDATDMSLDDKQAYRDYINRL